VDILCAFLCTRDTKLEVGSRKFILDPTKFLLICWHFLVKPVVFKSSFDIRIFNSRISNQT